MSDLRLVLASSSRYRAQLLRQLKIDFEQISPHVPELMHADESPEQIAIRLGGEKAAAVADKLDANSGWIVIGSDQVCHLDGEVFHKPGNFEDAVLQLGQFSNHWVNFETSLVLQTNQGDIASTSENYSIKFRPLKKRDIHAYLHLDEPYDCAGSIKLEQAGSALLQDARGRDFNSILGLPLMALVEQLDTLGQHIFDFTKRP